ncbi:MAG: radical SAM protein [Endomicrobiales bacterium]|nr:radical SAM protein [Endomicrobiales bacterium]
MTKTAQDSGMLLNRELAKKEIEEGKTVLSSKPQTLRIILTNRCNINCIMCEIGNRKKDETIPLEAISKIEPLLPSLDRIDWQGGEVFMVPYFRQFLESTLKHRHLTQTIQTNGLLLNGEWMDLIAKNNIALLISVNGMKKETYEKINRGASFEKLTANIELLSKKRAEHGSASEMTLCTCIMKSNYREIEEYVPFALKYGFGRISLGLLHGEQVPQERIGSGEADYLRTAVGNVERRCGENGLELECYFKPLLDNGQNQSKAEKQTSAPSAGSGSRVLCDMPWTNLSIDAIRGGNVYPECLCRWPIGNIMTDSMEDLWNGKKMQRYRKSMLENDVKICSAECFRVAECRQGRVMA